MKIKPIDFAEGVPYIVVTGKGSGGMVRKGDILLRSKWVVWWFQNGSGYPDDAGGQLPERDHHRLLEVKVLGILETAARIQ